MDDYINITLDNINEQHLCCAISDKKHQKGVNAKKEWLKDRIKEGHVFRKFNAQGKVFIEYSPLEYAWTPVVGDNYMYIYCLWVAGSFKDNGHGKKLLEYAINDAKKRGRSGICTISSKKKKPFISEKNFFVKFGFKVVDSIGEYELLSLSFDDSQPEFSDNAKKMKINDKEFTIFYSNQCPYVVNCIEEINQYVKETNKIIKFICVDTLEKAKSVPCVFNNWANFKDGVFVSNTLLNKNSVEKLIK